MPQRKPGRRPIGEGPGRTVAVRLPNDWYETLDAEARRRFVTMADLIREALRAAYFSPENGKVITTIG